GGMRIYSPHYIRRARELCDEFNLLLIFDEIATGFGRTGKMFACEHGGVSPDIMCLGKAITGGYMSFALAITTGHVAETISEGEPGVFMHGPTFMGNPLACSISIANINLLFENFYEDKVLSIEKQLKSELSRCVELPLVSDVRVLGAIGAVELKRPVQVALAVDNFVKRGVWIRPFGNVIYIMPPYIIKPQELSELTSSIHEVIKEQGC
ncbi:aminotransferase class III-fold pyridoxal phosphate-dependent enzyme, partial [Spirochaetota bacterium]